MKYEMLKNETIEINGHTLHRIRALTDFEANGIAVKAGEKGGYVENEQNLSQEGGCWVFDDAIVCGCARIVDDASVHGQAVAEGWATVKDCAVVNGHATINGWATVQNEAFVCGGAVVRGRATVENLSAVGGNAVVEGHARVVGGIVGGDTILF